MNMDIFNAFKMMKNKLLINKILIKSEKKNSAAETSFFMYLVKKFIFI